VQVYIKIDRIELGQGPRAGSCEHATEPVGSMKQELTDQMSD
jgi:hypothetical protein